MAQRPDRELIPLNAYTLEGYTPVDVTAALTLPDNFAFARVSGIVIDSHKDMLILHRGEDPLLKFDDEGNFPARLWAPRHLDLQPRPAPG